MSSNRRAMSRRLIPRIEAVRNTLSRPESSGVNPAPSSSRAAIRRWTAIEPAFGRRMPAMHLRRVDLPEPLCPITPTASPSRTSKPTSRSA